MISIVEYWCIRDSMLTEPGLKLPRLGCFDISYVGRIRLLYIHKFYFVLSIIDFPLLEGRTLIIGSKNYFQCH